MLFGVPLHPRSLQSYCNYSFLLPLSCLHDFWFARRLFRIARHDVFIFQSLFSNATGMHQGRGNRFRHVPTHASPDAHESNFENGNKTPNGGLFVDGIRNFGRQQGSRHHHHPSHALQTKAMTHNVGGKKDKKVYGTPRHEIGILIEGQDPGQMSGCGFFRTKGTGQSRNIGSGRLQKAIVAFLDVFIIGTGFGGGLVIRREIGHEKTANEPHGRKPTQSLDHVTFVTIANIFGSKKRRKEHVRKEWLKTNVQSGQYRQGLIGFVMTHGIVILGFGQEGILNGLEQFHAGIIENANGISRTLEGIVFVGGQRKTKDGQCGTHSLGKAHGC